ncbi:MAG: carboxypeptidase-like regulatory domain-containing protein [Candidatus Paceibacterota bacterium]|jgi:hypothetical protein
MKMHRFLKIIFLFSFFILGSFSFTLNIEANTGTITTGFQQSTFMDQDLDSDTFDDLINWKPTFGTAVSITDSTLTGDIWGESVGWIRLNPGGGYGGVSNTTSGVLSGYAWGENTGWINFKCTTNCASNGNFGVTISTSTGEFSGYAWAQNYGWIKFDCSGTDTAADADSYIDTCVKTDWRSTTGGGGGGGGSVSTPVVSPTIPPVISPITPPIVPPIFLPRIPPVILPVVPPTIPTIEPPAIPSVSPAVSPVTNSVATIQNFINGINKPIRNLLTQYLTPKQIEQTNTGLKIAAIASVVIGSIVSLATMLFLNPLAAPELILIPFRLWALLLTALGLRKKIKPWGTVYDSVTKQPLDPVYVSLFDLQGKEVGSSITDIDGRYGFYVSQGVYKVVPKKTNYIFPSHALSKQFSDELYQDLYFGDYLNLSEGEMIVKNIPMDPVNFDWNEFAKNKKQLFKFYTKKELILSRISNWLFGFGFTVATIALIISPEKYNMIIFGLYVVMFILRRTSFKLRAKGRIIDKDGSPLAFAFVRIFSIQTNVEIAHKVTDQMGRYYMLVPNGSYYVKIEKKNDDGTYSLIHTSNSIQIIHGTLNKVFNI